VSEVYEIQTALHF